MGGAISQNDITEDELLNNSQLSQTQTPITGTPQQTQTRQIVTPTSNNPPVQQKSNTAVHLNTTPQPSQNSIPLQVPTTPVPQTKNAPSKTVIQPPNAIVHKHLLDAVVAGNLQQLNLCLQNGGSVLVVDKEGNTPLHHACSKGFTEIVQTLVQCGAQLERKNTMEQTTPLYVAATKGHTAIVNLLISKGANYASPQREYNYTPLMAATHYGHLETVKLLLAKGTPLEIKSSAGLTALYIAVFNKFEPVVRFLAENGAQVNTTEAKGFTPLHCCSFYNIPSMVQFLLSRGANPNAQNIEERTTPLHDAATAGNLAVVELLVKGGAKLETKNTAGLTPLYNAVFHKKENVVRFLGDNGAQVNTSEAKGYTPLHCCSYYNEISMVRYLLEKGANVNAANKVDRFTPLQDACTAGNFEIVKLLVEKGANLEATCTQHQYTPLLTAAEKGHVQIVHYLLDNGANKYAQLSNGRGALDLTKNQSIKHMITTHMYRPPVQPQFVAPDISQITQQISSELRRQEQEIKQQHEQELKRKEESIRSEAEKQIQKERERIEKLYAKNVDPTFVQRRGKRIALLVGNCEYAYIGALPGPASDIYLISEKLRMLGFQVTIEMNLTTKLEMTTVLDHFTSLLQDADEELECCFFYYAGHGFQYQGVNYLLPTMISANEADLDKSCLSLNLVVDEIGASSCGKSAQVVVIDACRNEWRKTRSADEKGMAQMDTHGGTFLIYSTAPGTFAQDSCPESGDNSPFALAMCRAMQHDIELYEMYRNTSSEVQRMTKLAQTPYLSSCLASKVVL